MVHTSTMATTRTTQNSSKLSRRSSRPPPAGAIQRDPLEALKNILGSQTMDLSPPEDVKLGTTGHDDGLEEIAKWRIYEEDIDHSEVDFTQEISRYSSLHDEAQSSLVILDKLQQYLAKFHRDLEGLSSEMEALQQRSIGLTQKLKTREETEAELRPVVESLVIPPTMVRQIVEGEMGGEAWKQALTQFIKLKEEQKEFATMEKYPGSRALRECQELMGMLNDKCIERIRDFVVKAIRSMRMQNVNAQHVQSQLLEYKELFQFVRGENQELANDLRTAYVNTLKWYYSSRFGRYIKSLEKLPLHMFDKSMLLAGDHDTATQRRGFFQASTQQHAGETSQRTDMNIGLRGEILQSEDPSVMPAQIAETLTVSHYMESGFRSLVLALIDNAAFEYEFIDQFFAFDKPGELNHTFTEVFTPTFSQCHEYTKRLLQQAGFDSYGVLICIRLIKRFEYTVQQRKVPVLEDYLNLELINLWPRFQTIVDNHCESLRRAASKSSTLSTTDTSLPHHITQQFASWVHGVLSISPQDDAVNEPLSNSLLRLRNDFESFLTKVSSVLSNSANRERFLYHNYSLVSTILSDLSGVLASQQQEHFDKLIEAYNKK